MTLPRKYKVKITWEELLYLEDAIDQYCKSYHGAAPRRKIIAEDDELEVYRLSDLHNLLYNWIKPKINAMEKKGKYSGNYEMPLTHVMTLRHVLLKSPFFLPLQSFLGQIDRIKVNALPVVVRKTTDEILL